MTAADRATRVTLAAALAGVLSQGLATAASPTPGGPRPSGSREVEAIWRQHALTIGYQGFTTSYSCEGFKDKMRALLRWFGARPASIRLRTHGCAGGPYRASPAIELALEFETLAPLPSGDASTDVRGVWIERDLFGKTRVSRDAPSHIDRSDCELVQKFVAAVLPSFTHEIETNLTRCIPNQRSGSVPLLRVRVLAPRNEPEPRADARPTLLHARSGGDSGLLTHRRSGSPALTEDDAWHATRRYEAL